jgi:hypothetical protein
MRAVLQQADQAQLRERAGATPRSRTTKTGGVGRAVGDIKSAAVQADQPPVAIPRPPRGRRRDRPHQPLIQLPQRLFPQPAARLGDGAFARHLDRRRPPDRAQPVQQAAQHLAQARSHVERQRDDVVDHHMCQQIAFTLARTAALRQHLTHLFERERSGDHPKADVVADAHTGWQGGGCSTHGAYSLLSTADLGIEGVM